MNTHTQIAVIFDMDGVIVDSNPLITATWKAFFATHGIELSDDQLNHYVFGRMGKDTLRLVFGEDLTEPQIAAHLKKVEEGVWEKYQQQGVIVQGFKAFVEKLLAAGIKIAIATSSPSQNVKVVMEMAGTTSLFTTITDASQIQHSKPHPEIYLKTADKLGIDVSNCVVFEDSFSGIQSAKSAGMHVIGVTTTHTPAELAPLTAATVPDFTSISVAQIRMIAQQLATFTAQ